VFVSSNELQNWLFIIGGISNGLTVLWLASKEFVTMAMKDACPFS